MESEPSEDIESAPLSYYGVRTSREISSEDIQQQEDFPRLVHTTDFLCRSNQSYPLDAQPSLPSRIALDTRGQLLSQRMVQIPEYDKEDARRFYPVPRAENRGRLGEARVEERNSFSSQEHLFSRRPVSREVPRSSYEDAIDHTSQPQTMNSVSLNRRRYDEPRTKCTLTAFLVLLALASVIAVMIDTKWEPQATSHRGQLTSRDRAPVTATISEKSVEKQETSSLTTTTTTARHASRKRKKKYFAPGNAVAHVSKRTEEPFAPLLDTLPISSPKLKKKRKHKTSLRPRKLTEEDPDGLSPATETTRSTAVFKRHLNILAAPMPRPTKHRCGMAYYTYCSALREEIYYRHTTRSCVRTATDHTQVCNRSPNRFASFEACKQRCVRGELPAESCFEKTLFSGCTREDVSSIWWFFDGKHCQPWNFPGGLCPDIAHSHVFVSRSECLRRCSVRPQVLSRRHRGGGRYTVCRRPKTGAICTIDVLRFPYFAEISPIDGRVQCLNSSAAQLRKHRCLTGSNRFISDSACRRACVHTAMGQGPNHGLFGM